MPRDELEHVIQEADSLCSRGNPLAVEADREGNPRLGSPPVDHCAAHRTSSITVMHRRVCFDDPRCRCGCSRRSRVSVERSRMYTARERTFHQLLGSIARTDEHSSTLFQYEAQADRTPRGASPWIR